MSGSGREAPGAGDAPSHRAESSSESRRSPKTVGLASGRATGYCMGIQYRPRSWPPWNPCCKVTSSGVAPRRPGFPPRFPRVTPRSTASCPAPAGPPGRSRRFSVRRKASARGSSRCRRWRGFPPPGSASSGWRPRTCLMRRRSPPPAWISPGSPWCARRGGGTPCGRPSRCCAPGRAARCSRGSAMPATRSCAGSRWRRRRAAPACSCSVRSKPRASLRPPACASRSKPPAAS